jgi:hypothetical protein
MFSARCSTLRAEMKQEIGLFGKVANQRPSIQSSHCWAAPSQAHLTLLPSLQSRPYLGHRQSVQVQTPDDTIARPSAPADNGRQASLQASNQSSSPTPEAEMCGDHQSQFPPTPPRHRTRTLLPWTLSGQAFQSPTMPPVLRHMTHDTCPSGRYLPVPCAFPRPPLWLWLRLPGRNYPVIFLPSVARALVWSLVSRHPARALALPGLGAPS